MSEARKKEYGENVCLTDWGKPEILDGALVQYMVTLETGMGYFLAYFGTREDAELFARAKVEQLTEEAGL